MTGRSVTDTFSTASSYQSGQEDSITITIGDHGEPVGKYRYSLFCTSDVYYVLITDAASNKEVNSYIAVCARQK